MSNIIITNGVLFAQRLNRSYWDIFSRNEKIHTVHCDRLYLCNKPDLNFRPVFGKLRVRIFEGEGLTPKLLFQKDFIQYIAPISDTISAYLDKLQKERILQ